MCKRPPLPLLAVGLLAASLARAASGQAAAAFETLGSNVGDWEATSPNGKTLRLSYRLVSAGSVLVETFGVGSGRETLTVYHLDGPDLILTHYCAQGNQPRLRMDPASGKGAVAFDFFDATNLASPKDSHLQRLEVRLIDADHFDRAETYRADGKDDTSVLKLSRVKPQ